MTGSAEARYPRARLHVANKKQKASEFQQHKYEQVLGTFGATTPSIAYQDAEPYMPESRSYLSFLSFSLDKPLLRLRGRRRCLTLLPLILSFLFIYITDLLAPSAGVDLRTSCAFCGRWKIKTEDCLYVPFVFFLILMNLKGIHFAFVNFFFAGQRKTEKWQT